MSACWSNQTRREKKIAMKRMVLSSSFRAGLIVFIAIFGTLYVWQTTSVSTNGYVIADLERQVVNLKHETKKLDVDVATNSSMQNIQARLEGRDLVSVANVEYITPVGTAVAVR